jgi:hypothetical protein
MCAGRGASTRQTALRTSCPTADVTRPVSSPVTATPAAGRRARRWRAVPAGRRVAAPPATTVSMASRACRVQVRSETSASVVGPSALASKTQP